jgi:hypothetical protein
MHMIVQSFGAGALNLEKENDQFFWTRDNEKSQNFKSRDEAVKALKGHGLRWSKVKK